MTTMDGPTGSPWRLGQAVALGGALLILSACGEGEEANSADGVEEWAPPGAEEAEAPDAALEEAGEGPAGPVGPPSDEELAAALAESSYLGPVGDAGRAVITGDTTPEEEEIDPDAPWVETEKDREILHETVTWAREQGLQELPMGEIMGLVGSTFVGVPYRESPLEVPGDERLVVDLRGMDCVTFVEQVLAMSRLVREVSEEDLDDPEALAEQFRDVLTTLRYRDGELDGYLSRLHYFSEWISDNEAKGLVEDLTRGMGGEAVTEPISFMSSNPDAYRQLDEEPDLVDEIRSVEETLSDGERYVIPQDEIARLEEGIRTGDIIAATSTVEGLDVAHTGLAFWHQGRLHLLHAPLEDGTVEISERPLAERIQNIDGQDGIIVARPLDPGGA